MKIEQTGYEKQTIWPVAESAVIGKKTDVSDTGTDRTQERRDSFIPEESTSDVGRIWKEVCSGYPGVRFMLCGEEIDEAAVEQLAQQYGKGGFVVLSKEFLTWMSEGEDAWKQGMEMIAKAKAEIGQALLAGNDGAGVVLANNGEEFRWTMKMVSLEEAENAAGLAGGQSDKEDANIYGSVSSMEDMELEGMRKMLEKMKEAKNKPLIKVKKKINYSMGRDMSKLCRVSQDRAIRSFISGVYAKRAQIGGSSSYDKKERSAAVAKMDYVIRCARTKIRQVKEEEQLKARAEKLEKAKKEKERLRVEKELKERQIKRRAKEHARIFAELPDLPGLRSREEQKEIMREFNQSMEAGGMPAATDVAVGAAAGAAAGGAAVAAGTAGSAADMQIASVSVQSIGLG